MKQGLCECVEVEPHTLWSRHQPCLVRRAPERLEEPPTVVALRAFQCLWSDADLFLSFGAFWSLGNVCMASPYPSQPRRGQIPLSFLQDHCLRSWVQLDLWEQYQQLLLSSEIPSRIQEKGSGAQPSETAFGGLSLRVPLTWLKPFPPVSAHVWGIALKTIKVLPPLPLPACRSAHSIIYSAD